MSYRLHDSYASLPRLSSPLLVVMLQGWIDASGAAHAAMQRLVAETGATTLVTFDADEFLDFRARRPTMELRQGINTGLVWPSTELMLGRDINDKEILLLTGHEPDTKWNRFADVVADLSRELGVRKMIGLGAYPFATPHTRAVNLSCTSPSSDVIGSLPYVRSSVDVPAGIEAVLEHVLTGRGIPSVGIWAQVPHYATSMAYPPATVALLGAVCDTGGVSLDVSAVRAEAGQPGVHVAAERRHVVATLLQHDRWQAELCEQRPAAREPFGGHGEVGDRVSDERVETQRHNECGRFERGDFFGAG